MELEFLGRSGCIDQKDTENLKLVIEFMVEYDKMEGEKLKYISKYFLILMSFLGQFF